MKCNNCENEFLENMLSQYTDMLNKSDELREIKRRLKAKEKLTAQMVLSVMGVLESAIDELDEDLDAIEQEGLF